MSADNGIYILETKAPERDGCEYRVTEAASIGNLYYDVETGYDNEDFIPEEAFRFFGRCQVLESEEEALLYAHKEAESCYILEYGVCSLSHPEQVFETFSDEKLKAHEEETEMLIEAHRQERQAKWDEARKVATLRLPPGTKVLPGYCPGVVFVTPEGKEIRGTLKLPELILSEDTDFLPHDWDKNE